MNCTYSNYTEAADTCSAAQKNAHLLYKYCTNCTFCNCTVFTVITQKTLTHVQLHKRKHIYCKHTVRTLQSVTELYLQ